MIKDDPRQVTIHDVARQAGVGVGTVSRVLNDHPSVAATTRAHVLAVMQELRFSPNSAAQNIRRKVTRCFGIVVPNLVNPFFAELVQAIEHASRQQDHHIFLMNSSDDPASERECVESLARRRIDGLLLVPVEQDGPPAYRLKAPVVYIDRLPPGVSGVAADHAAGAQMMARHLLECGHRRIGLIAGPDSSIAARLRRSGFETVMVQVFAAQGLSLEDYIYGGDFDPATGIAGLQHFMDMPVEKRPTAIMTSADQQAIGALNAALMAGIAVPQDLSLTGFDGTMIAGLVYPSITTISQPITRLGEIAVEMLLRQTRQQGSSEQILLECEIRNGATVTSFGQPGGHA